jgi:hypothetical protein
MGPAGFVGGGITASSVYMLAPTSFGEQSEISRTIKEDGIGKLMVVPPQLCQLQPATFQKQKRAGLTKSRFLVQQSFLDNNKNTTSLKKVVQTPKWFHSSSQDHASFRLQ